MVTKGKNIKRRTSVINNKSRRKSYNKLNLLVIKGKVLGVDVYRGFARLCDLANISEADVFDQKTNPMGTQRDLNPQHARSAYQYVKTHDLAFWPEVFLCARNKKVLNFKPSSQKGIVGTLQIDITEIKKSLSIAISRVDGNHRLHFAAGHHQDMPPIRKEVSFCLAYKLNQEQEITLFTDINNNQRRMNTSHLDNIKARLTPEERQKREVPTLYIAKKLGKDENSPFFDMVYEGGKKTAAFMIPLRTLKSGIKYMMSIPTKLTALPDPDAQYTVIRNFFAAVKKWQPAAWKEPSKYLLLRGAGLWAICYVGAEVINRTLTAGKFQPTDMLDIFKSGSSWDWSKHGSFEGYSGAGGAKKIRDKIVAEFADETGISIRTLAKKIMQD